MRDWGAYVRGRLNLAGLRADRAERVVRELAEQLEDCWREARAAGATDEEADARARAQIADWATLAADIRHATPAGPAETAARLAERAETAAQSHGWAGRLAADLIQDVRYAVRQLGTQPGFAAVAILTLALGIGATTAIFSAVHAVLLRPLPYADPDRLAVVSISWPEGRFWMSEREVLLLRDEATRFEGFAVLDESGGTLLGDAGPQAVNVALVSQNAFDLLGVAPALGRGFTPDEERPEAPPTAVLSHELWRDRFGGDPAIVGQTIAFDGAPPVRVIGVMPPRFEVVLPLHVNFHRRVDLWTPHRVDYASIDRGRNLVVIARAKPGVSWPQAQDELDRIARGFFPEGSQNTYRAFPLHADAVEGIRPALLTLMAATGVVLLIVCANVAGLLLARGVARRKEMALRGALGASRGRMLRQALTESAVLTAVGGGAGVLLAWVGGRVLTGLLPPDLPRLQTIAIDPVVLAVSAGISLAAGVGVGLAPAWRASRLDLRDTLAEGGRGAAGGGARLRQGLIAAEVALTLVLLVAGSLVVRSFLNVGRASPGFNAQDVIGFTVPVSSERYPTAADRERFFATLRDRFAALPGVSSAGGNAIRPFGTSLFQVGATFYDVSAAEPSRTEIRQTLMRPILPGYLETLEARLVAGRAFTDADAAGADRVAIIDETLAASVYPGQNPIGKRLARGGNPPSPAYTTIVGVVENQRLTDLTGERHHQVYVPYGQLAPTRMTFVLRTTTPAAALVPTLRGVVHEVDPRVALADLERMEDTLAQVMAPERMTSVLMTFFAAVGLLLALVGIYGVIAYRVHQQTHDIGVRVALGAARGDIYRMVLRSGLTIAAAGVALGLAAAGLLLPPIERLLVGVSSTDPLHYAATAALLIGATLLACLVPARRAARIDPAVALRHE